MSRRQRIFIGLTEIAGYFGGLREGFEELGFEVFQINEALDVYGDGHQSKGSTLGGFADQLYRYELTTPGLRGRLARPAQLSVRAARLPYRVAALAQAMRSCDVFVFGGRASFLREHDLTLLRRAGKRIVWVFLGTDHRPPYLNGKIVRERMDDPRRLIADARTTMTRIQHIERSVDAVVAHSPSAHFHARQFAEFLSVGAPVRTLRPNDEGALGEWPGPDGVRVLHCPTDPAKGSVMIRAAIERIRARGIAISYLELTGRPNAEVRARLTQADLVVDEVFSDTPMALFVTEAATAGVPSVVGGYWARDIAASFRGEAIPPSAYVHPVDLEPTIERLVVDESERRELGRRAHEFVSTVWRPEQVARRILALANGRPEGLVIRKPDELTYCAGWGMPIETQREVVRRMVKAGGSTSLALGHNPPLEARMLADAEDGVEVHA